MSRFAELEAALPSPLTRLDWAPLRGVELWLKRDDLIHPVISGNKWRKLKGLFAEGASALGAAEQVLSFGGARSHLLPALALALHKAGLKGLFVVRGEELNAESNPTLSYCARLGVELYFERRERYQALRERAWRPEPEELARWGATRGAFVLAEGGDAESARAGCAELWRELAAQWAALSAQQLGGAQLDELWLCAGTGATARGLLSGIPAGSRLKLQVISAVRGARREEAQTRALAATRSIELDWLDERRFGGFGRLSPELSALRERFIAETGLWIDAVYQAKLLWELIARRAALSGRRVIWLHTGGLREL